VTSCDIEGKHSGNAVGFHMNLSPYPWDMWQPWCGSLLPHPWSSS